MFDLGAVSFEWGTMIFQLIVTLIVFVIPGVLMIYLIYRCGLKRKVTELEQRIEQLEKERRK
ncbi:hypothetical protein LOK74_18935 [Brevibacillus humidisoli]|uniref:hypothetical protein n=1 Tax=Brevibacillus humidisoli TaxID=2895522 RepID=UPI001E304850|nr:hypothetical protein [Brevibacillus humidisoli]UFJ40089.1 hypothetical protein LOK74_18935 [Brevibacillus humidisoli]